MTYEETLKYIHSVQWRGSKPGLSRTRELLARIGNPQKKLKFVHVAGTNGKGSTAALVASVLHAAGYRTGLYTSPYIGRFNERLQVDGEQIPDEELAALTDELRPLADSMEDQPTEFELITAMGFLWFARRACDIVVLEVGLGGELDSTNVISCPELAVLTAMGYDHMAVLGKTMREIAQAKAGIIKGGIVVSYGNEPEAEAVFQQKCAETGASLMYPNFDSLQLLSYDLTGQNFSFSGWKNLCISLVGAYQMKNAAVALTAIEALRRKGWEISENAVREGLNQASWPARFEVLGRHPVFIVDGGHNPQGVKAAAESLRRLFPRGNITFLMGVMADKDVGGMVTEVVPLAKEFFTVRPENPRSMSAEELEKRLCLVGTKATACGTVTEGVRAAIRSAGKDGVVCALGSLYMAGDVKKAYRSAAEER